MADPQSFDFNDHADISASEDPMDWAKKENFHTRCHDCGKFLKKRYWVTLDHSWKKHALCPECLSGYDY